MKNLLNHTELVLNIKNANLENANILYMKKIEILFSFSSDQREFKKLLYSINAFIYTYFCNDLIPLEDLCCMNLSRIDKCYSKEDLISLGSEIVKSYMKIINTDKVVSENEIIKNALIFIDLNIANKITLETVADHIHISSNYLCYLFKEKTGFKFCEYINICRINMAKDFLDNSSNHLEIISFKSGFNSQSHFCTTFKKYVGASPNEYRKRTL